MMAWSNQKALAALKERWELDRTQALLEDLVKKYEERLETLKLAGNQLLGKDDNGNGSVQRSSDFQDKSCGGGEIEEAKAYIFKLPDDVLEMIFCELESPKDFSSCLATCSKFWSVLEPKRTRVYLPEVLPHVMKFLDPKEFLDCRLVCKCWRDTIDKIVADVVNREGQFARYLAYLPRRRSGRIARRKYGGFVVDLEDVTGELSQFMTEMDNNLLNNPFIGRMLAVCDGFASRNKVIYWNNIGRVLERFGKLIWNCSIGLMAAPDGDDELLEEQEEEEENEETDKLKEIGLVTKVRDCLTRLPNVKSLSVSMYGEPYYSFDQDENDRDFKEICERFPVESFPPLPSLVELRLESASLLFYNVMPIQYWNQLKTLRIRDFDLRHIFSVGHNLDILFPNLQELFLMEVGRYWRDLTKLNLLKSPLVSLNVTSHNSNIDLVSFIRVFHHFGPTLRSARIAWEEGSLPRPDLSSTYLSACIGLSAPHLKVIELRNPTESLNFLVCLPGLEHLTIIYQDNVMPNPFVAKRKHEILEIHGFVECMYTSNIWINLPSIKGIHFFGSLGKFCYTRKGYQDFVNEADCKMQKLMAMNILTTSSSSMKEKKI